MCGIYGHFIKNNKDLNYCHKSWNQASVIMNNRGPDAKNFISSKLNSFHGLLCHRRLAIIDTASRSNQPMASKDNLISFNGEIYNFLELKADLQSKGISFITESDTEVLLNGLISDGDYFINQLDGPFAFAYLNQSEKSLTLARDNFGEKPLYYYHSNDELIFSSSYEAISIAIKSKTLDDGFINNFFNNGYSKNKTLFQNIHKVRSGEVIKFIFQSEISKEIVQLNSFDYSNKNNKFDINFFEKLFIESLKRRLIADVPIALLLSGGIDSSYIATIAKQELNYDFKCISIDDGMGSEKDIQNAIKLTENLNIPHKIIKTDGLPLKNINKILFQADDVISDPAYYIQTRLISYIPDKVKVLITGDGSDELFLSYSNYLNIFKNSSSLKDKISDITILRLNKISRVLSPRIRRILLRLSYLLPLSSNDLFIIERCLSNDIEFLENTVLSKHKSDLMHQKAIDYDLAEYLLRKADLSSTFYSKELRSPFLSNKIFKYVLSCDFNSINIGKKDYLISSLNTRLGNGFDFKKRGLFAGGQKKISDKLNSDLTFLPNNIIEKIHRKDTNDHLFKYRILVLRNYLSKFKDMFI